MPRVKIYDTWEIPAGVAKIAKAICADYDRRAAAIRKGEGSEELLEEYRRLNVAVDAALEEVDAAMRADLLASFKTWAGYEKSHAHMYVCENSFYARKRQVVYLVAKELSLV